MATPPSQPATVAEQESGGCPAALGKDTSTGFLPIGIAAVLLLCAWLFGLLG